MSPTTVIITSAGTASAVNVLKSLRLQHELPLRLVALDADYMAAGLHLADAHHVIPKATDPSYFREVLRVIELEQAAVFIPVYSREIATVVRDRQRLERSGVRMLLPSIETFETCDNKERWNLFATSLGLRIPRCLTEEDLRQPESLAFPLFAKPRVASSSTGAVRLDDLEDLLYQARKTSGLMVQEFISGAETTIDVFCDTLHNPLVISPRLRLATKSGQSVKAKTTSADPFRAIVETVCRAVRMVGVCNFQFISNDKESVLIEVNPRYAAGGLMATVMAGANIPLMVVKTALGLPISPSETKARVGLSMSRYWEEVFF